MMALHNRRPRRGRIPPNLIGSVSIEKGLKIGLVTGAQHIRDLAAGIQTEIELRAVCLPRRTEPTNAPLFR